jgi:hypothetical protein
VVTQNGATTYCGANFTAEMPPKDTSVERTGRGLFGRGLKESIIALGQGEIETTKDGKLNVVKIWWDKKRKEALFDLEDEIELKEKQEEGTTVKTRYRNKYVTILLCVI